MSPDMFWTPESEVVVWREIRRFKLFSSLWVYHITDVNTNVFDSAWSSLLSITHSVPSTTYYFQKHVCVSSASTTFVICFVYRPTENTDRTCDAHFPRIPRRAHTRINDMTLSGELRQQARDEFKVFITNAHTRNDARKPTGTNDSPTSSNIEEELAATAATAWTTFKPRARINARI